jgi:hypothetical protein
MEFNWGHDEASCPQLNTLSMMWNQYEISPVRGHSLWKTDFGFKMGASYDNIKG